MKKLNKQATKVFCALLKRMKDDHLKLTAPEFMPLTIERLERDIQTPWGKATRYSLAHHFVQQGDLMNDPEVCFIVVDNRQHPVDYIAISIYPHTYRLDSLGLDEESALVENGKLTKYIKRWQEGHCDFANQWLLNIHQQGFLR